MNENEQNTQLPGQPATVSAAAEATGAIDSGHFIETDIDRELFRFNSDDTPLMNLMLQAKRVKVNSPEVDHYMIDEPRSYVLTSQKITAGGSQVILPLAADDQELPRPNATLLLPDIDGYDADGRITPGRPLMVMVVGFDTSTNNPVVRPVNGAKDNPTDEGCKMPDVPQGTKCIFLSNALYETQKEVDPDLIVPIPTRVYLQKRGMNQVVSDYFESQRKRIPFGKAVIAEQAIANFKVRGNRTLWAGRPGKMKINVNGLGMQYAYCTEGIRWQFKREMQSDGHWTVEKIIALAKMFFTGEDAPKTALLLAGKDLLEAIQCVDYSKHPEIQISSRRNSVGWVVTTFHTVFGDIDIKREPTLDRLGWSHSGAMIGENRLVHYVYSAEHSFSDRVDGQEATRHGILIWDALALKGSCHIWIDGDSFKPTQGSTVFNIWDKASKPEGVDGVVYYLVVDCPAIGNSAKAGQLWTVDPEDPDSWVQYSGKIY